MRTMTGVCASLAMLAAAVPAGAQSVSAGIEAWQRTEYAQAVKIWRPLAESGDADAQFNLGQAYRLGRGVPTNLAAAQSWLQRAAAKGHLDAQSTLGLLLFDSGNRVGGLRWLKAAAESGEPRALLIYGTALFNGDGVTRDPVLAYAYVSRAAAQDLAPAKATLAEMDEVLPIEQRKKGVAIAIARAKPAAKTPAKPAPTIAATKPPAILPPPAKPTPAASSSAVTPATGGWRVQLGAFSQRSSAEALFRKLAGAGPLAGRRPYFIPVGAMTRLQAGPFASRAAAAAACTGLSARGQACFPVAAK